METVNALKKELAEKEADLQKLTSELSDTYEELVLLYDFNDAIHSTFDPDEIAQLLLKLAVDALSVKRGLYLWPSEDGKEFTVKFHHGIDENRIENYKVRFGEGAIGKSIESSQPSIICNVNTRSELKESAWGWKHLLSVPLVAKGKIIGVIALAEKVSGEVFLSNDKKLITSLASIAAYVIENAKMYQALDTAYEKLKSTQEMLIQTEKLATVGQISAGVAHEINNPLTGVLGYTELTLMELPRDAPNRKNLEIIKREAIRCMNIARNLLDFSRQQKEDFTLVHINNCLEETLAIIGYQVTKSGIEIIKEFDASLPYIEANANQLMQVFINLITNANHAMPDGGKITIHTAFDATDSTVTVEIADTGCGISEKNLLYLFEPFFTTKEKGKGTGLGLYVSHSIIKEHNGAISVESSTEEGMSGTTFTIKLPTRQPEGADEQVSAGTDISQGDLTQMAKKVLVADDEAHIVRMVADKLIRGGFDVTQVRDGAAALQKAKSEKFDLIITDILMPKLDGYSLTKQLKSDPLLREIPVIMLTARGQEEDEIKGKEAGADEFITKPFSPRKLLEQVVQMVNG